MATEAQTMMSFPSFLEAIPCWNKFTAGFMTNYNPSMAEDDFRQIGIRVLLITLLRFIISGAYHPRLRWLPCALDLIAVPMGFPDKNRAKFLENTWYTCWHTLASVVGGYIFFTSDWTMQIRNTFTIDNVMQKGMFVFSHPYEESLFIGWKTHIMSPLEKEYYLTQLAFWTSCFIYIFIEVQRSDFYQMLTHHCATMGLVYLSYIHNYWHIGMFVLLCHDPVDIFLYAAKATRILANQTKSALIGAVVETFWVIFAVSFFVFRLVIFGCICVHNGWKSGMHPSALLGSADIKIDPDFKKHGHGQWVSPILLLTLLCLHCFWFSIIVRVVYKQATTKKNIADMGDARSDDEDSDEDPMEEVERQKKEMENKKKAVEGKKTK